MAQNHSAEYVEKPMTRDGRIQGPSRRYRRLRHPTFPSAEWAAKNPLLQRGEIGAESDTHRIKVGDGVTYWNDLPYTSDVIAHWGDIQGTLTDQEDLTQYVANAVAAEATLRENADSGLQGQITTNKGTMDGHIADKNNPHEVTKAQIGLGNVDNTADLDKPVIIKSATIPTASADLVGKEYQYFGETNGTYTHGFVYECSVITTPSSITASQTTGASLSDIAVDIDTFETYVEPTTDTTLVFTYDNAQSEWIDAEENIVQLSDYGISYTGTPENDDVITVAYTAEAISYDWVRVNLQPVIDNLTSTSTTAALSANQGKVLNDRIDDVSGRGRFLALWNCATGLAATNPPQSPYTYKAGDYFVVGTVSSATPAVNYKPDGSSYTTGVASTTVETNEVSINDTYFYDGTTWKLQSNAQKEVSFSALAGSPYDNTNLSNALNAKQDTLTAGANITIDANNVISSTAQESFFRGRWTNWSSVPSNGNEYPEDYHGNRKPTDNDYMVVTDASAYVPDLSNMPRVEFRNMRPKPDGVQGASICDVFYYPDGINEIVTYNFDCINNGIYKSVAGGKVLANWWYGHYWTIKANATVYYNGRYYNSGDEIYNGGNSISTIKIYFLDSINTYEGSWRFMYIGTWATDGKNGWKPEYQVEDVLPIATDTEQGIAKLYTTTGQNTDGSMTQKSITDALDAKQDVIQVSTMPAASADNLGSIVQWIGATDTYTNGYFYQCALITTPSSATVTANEGSDITDLEINLEDFESYVEPTGNMTLVFTYDDNQGEWLDAEQNVVDLSDYGISYTGTQQDGDTITVVYTAESSTYGWVAKKVQGITVTYNAVTEELTIS